VVNTPHDGIVHLMRQNPISLLVSQAKPVWFSEQVIRGMKQHCCLTIIFPLSNPSRQVEPHQSKLIEWTEGEVIIATAVPFNTSSDMRGKLMFIAQCNNSIFFPVLVAASLLLKLAWSVIENVNGNQRDFS